MSFEIWIYRGLIGLLLLVLWWVIRSAWNQLNEKFDKLIEAVERANVENIKQTKDIENLEKRVDTHDERLNDHSKRILKIETGGKV